MDTSVVTARPSHPLRLADLSHNGDTDVSLTPDEAARRAIAEDLGINAIRKLRFEARLSPLGKRDWTLEGTLGATVVQDCVVTLEPVVTRIDETVTRKYLADLPEPQAGEVEMPEDDSAESLPSVLDIADVMIEALALALPPFPRSDAAKLDEMVVTEPGATPLTDDQMKPFAGLASLRDALKNNGSKDG